MSLLAIYLLAVLLATGEMLPGYLYSLEAVRPGGETNRAVSGYLRMTQSILKIQPILSKQNIPCLI